MAGYKLTLGNALLNKTGALDSAQHVTYMCTNFMREFSWGKRMNNYNDYIKYLFIYKLVSLLPCEFPDSEILVGNTNDIAEMGIKITLYNKMYYKVLNKFIRTHPKTTSAVIELNNLKKLIRLIDINPPLKRLIAKLRISEKIANLAITAIVTKDRYVPDWPVFVSNYLNRPVAKLNKEEFTHRAKIIVSMHYAISAVLTDDLLNIPNCINAENRERMVKKRRYIMTKLVIDIIARIEFRNNRLWERPPTPVWAQVPVYRYPLQLVQ